MYAELQLGLRMVVLYLAVNLMQCLSIILAVSSAH